MNENFGSGDPHPAGESKNMRVPVANQTQESELVIDTPGGRYRASFA